MERRTYLLFIFGIQLKWQTLLLKILGPHQYIMIIIVLISILLIVWWDTLCSGIHILREVRWLHVSLWRKAPLHELGWFRGVHRHIFQMHLPIALTHVRRLFPHLLTKLFGYPYWNILVLWGVLLLSLRSPIFTQIILWSLFDGHFRLVFFIEFLRAKFQRWNHRFLLFETQIGVELLHLFNFIRNIQIVFTLLNWWFIIFASKFF